MDIVELITLQQELRDDRRVLNLAAARCHTHLQDAHSGRLEAAAFELARCYNIIEQAAKASGWQGLYILGKSVRQAASLSKLRLANHWFYSYDLDKLAACRTSVLSACREMSGWTLPG